MSLSYSQLRRYRTCPRQYEFLHVKKIPWGISEGESFGASVHNALKRWGEEEIKTLGVLGRDSGLGIRDSEKKKRGAVREDQLGLFIPEERPQTGLLTEGKLLEIWHQSFVFNTFPTQFEADFARRRGEEMMRQFFLWWSRSPRSVVAVEKSFSLTIDGTAITGRLDRIGRTESGVRIVDYKTTAPCTREEADADLQLSLYALASETLFEKPFDSATVGLDRRGSAQGKPCTELLLLFLSDGGVVERSTVRSASQLKDARTQIRLIRERMEAKDFHPTPGVAVCKRCPYRGICDVAAV